MHRWRRTTRVATIIATGLLVAATGCMPAPGTTNRITLSSTGSQASSGGSGGQLSGNGRFVAFASTSNDLVPGDAARARSWDDADVFVRDVSAGTTELISVTPDGTSGDHRSWPVAISDDGRHVLFTSEAANLTDDLDDGGTWDVFLRDREADTTALLSAGADGGPSREYSTALGMSDDARYVLMEVWDPTVADGLLGPMVLDRSTGSFEAVPLAPTMEDSSWMGGLVLSGDGGTVAYTGLVRNPLDGSLELHQFIWDRTTEVTQQISPPELATPPAGSLPVQSDPTISDDGDLVLWGRQRGEDAPYTPGNNEVFAWHRGTGQVTQSTPADHVSGFPVQISGDGQWAVSPSVIDRNQLVLWNLEGGGSHRIGGGPESYVRPSSISDDGRYITFATRVALVPEDTNNVEDGYLSVRPD